MRRKGRPKKQKTTKVVKVPGKRGRPRKKEIVEDEPPQKKAKRGRPRTIKIEQDAIESPDDPLRLSGSTSQEATTTPDDNYSEGLHMSTMQVRALSSLVACLDCGEEVVLGVRPTTKGMISEFTVFCKVCDSQKSTNTPNLIRERKRKREKKGVILQKNENINYAHVSAFLDNGLGYSGLRHYCRYFNARCLNEATFIVYAKQVIADVVAETEDFLQQNARIVRKAFESQIDSDYIVDLTVGYTTTYHQWGSDFCLVAGAVIELQTGLVLDYDVGNMYCHVCKINAKKIVSMSPAEMTDWFNKHQDTCEIREWCDEIDQDSEEGIKEIDPKYLEAFIAKKMWSRSLNKFGFRYTTLIHESDERIHSELLKAAPYGDIPVIIDNITNCFSRRKSEHARTSFQNKLKAKCPRERVQTKDRIMYVYAMSIPEYNKFAIGSNIKLRELVRRMEIEEEEYQYTAELTIQASDILPAIRESEEKAAELKEIGDAFELEEEEEIEEQRQLHQQRLQQQQQRQASHKAQQPPVDVEREEIDIDEDEEEDIEDEEEEEEEEEEEVVVQECTESKEAIVTQEETYDSKDIEGFEVLEEEEEEIEEEIIDNPTDQRMPSTTTASKGNPSSIIIRTETSKSSEKVVKRIVSNTDAQSLGKRDTQISQEKPAGISTDGKASSQLPSKVTPSSSGKVIVSSGEKISLVKGSEKKKVMPLGETQAVGTSGSGGENVVLSKTPITIKSSDRATERNVIGEKADSSEPKKIVVMTGKKPVTNSFSAVEIRKGEESEERKGASSSSEVKGVAPSVEKVKHLVIEKKGKHGNESEGLRKEPKKHEASSSSSERKDSTKLGKSFSENGTEVKNRPSKQPEVVKPFRVDFDED